MAPYLPSFYAKKRQAFDNLSLFFYSSVFPYQLGQ